MTPYRIKYILIILVSFISFHEGFSAIIGVPNIKNHPKEEYKAGNQNWAIEQDALGVMYFANNNGVLIYDGTNWVTIPVPNNSVVRSLKFNGENKMLVGAFNEIGVIERDSLGEYRYTSWVYKIPQEERQFADIWKIHISGKNIFFQSYSYVFIFDEHENLVSTYKSDNQLAFSFLVKDRIIVQDKSAGLLEVRNPEFIPLDHIGFPEGLEIWEIIAGENNEWLLFTQQKGIFIWDENGFMPWNSELNNYLKKNDFYCLSEENGFLYIGTVQKGLIIADKKGTILKVIDRNSGLQNNTILSSMLDKEKNLWLGLDNGIDFIELNSNVQYIGHNGSYGSGYCSAIWENNIYLGTNQGVFKTSTHTQENVVLLNSLKGQVWGFWKDEDQLLCAHHKGIYSIRENRVQEIKLLPGCWIFMPLPWDTNTLIVGTYNGIGLLKKRGNEYRFEKMVDGFSESSRVMFFDKTENLWISHGYKGLFKIKLNTISLDIESVDFYGTEKGLPSLSNNEIFFIRDEMIISTVDGMYQYDEKKDSIIPYPLWNRFLGSSDRVTKMFELNENNIYIFQKGILGKLEILNDSLFMYNMQIVPFLENQFIEAFENILFINENTLLVGIEDGFTMIDLNREQKHEFNLPFLFTRLECFASHKFEDYFQPLLFDTYSEPINITEKITYKYNNIRVGFSVPLYNTAKNILFSFDLNETHWEGQPNQKELILTNLHEGKYTLKINLLDTKTGQKLTRSILFIIYPPWYRQWYFYALAGIVFLSIVLISYLIIKRRIDRERRRELIAQKRKMIQREISLKQKSALAEKELIKMRNEKLQTEVIHKSKELANSTMNIIHKNQILTDLKNEMMEMSDNQLGIDMSEIKSLIKKIDIELEDKQNWSVFETHFDRVHENFFQRLREKHEELSPKDLRMCAFLRMNLSSKEIAPLQNISIRSVEISRYRLRRKLKIPHEQNLTDYIMNI